jgi:predicted nucleic acid-binding protein
MERHPRSLLELEGLGRDVWQGVEVDEYLRRERFVVEWLDALRGQTVALDTAPLIYFIERHPIHAAKLKPFFAAAERRELRIVTTFVTLLEVLIHPSRNGRDDLARDYRDILLRSPGLTALPVAEDIAEEAARLRAVHGLKTPDAISWRPPKPAEHRGF